MDDLVTQIKQAQSLIGCLDTVYLDGRLRVDIINVQASRTTILNDPVNAGGYLTIMGNNGAYNPDFPDYPASAFVHRFMVTVLPESRWHDTLVLPTNAQIQAIRIHFPQEQPPCQLLMKDSVDDFFVPLQLYQAGWQFQLLGELRYVVNSVWNCRLSGEARRMWMLGKMYEILALAISQSRPQSLAEKATTLVRQQIDLNWTIASLAKALATNECYLKQAFHQEYGIGVASWIQQYRIQQAQHQLKSGLKPVTDVAFSLGFQTSSYFAKVFKRHIGLTPSEFRKINS
ncbi:MULTISPECIES: helix-turn-helix transcriptional regulator [unclassified Agarivorans]|uniref:helix-turn-helix transcriptional regulator n=1 Tax=unclassified Agarivorans TaxID=2636026 RepID=UPI003D7F00EA